MSAFSEFIGSSAALQLISMGIALILGVQHLWMMRRAGDAHAWVAIWSLLACLFLGARGVQLTTTEREAALVAGKTAIALGPFLVWALVGFGTRLNDSGLPRGVMSGLAAISGLWALGVFATPWFVDPVVTTRTDVFGAEHFSVHARRPLHFLNLYVVSVLVWGIRRLRLKGGLASHERRILVAGFGSYALLGACAVLTTMGLLEIPAMAEYGPVIVAVSLSHLLVHRGRRVELRLEELIRQQGSRLAASEERYRGWVNHAPLGILACDSGGSVSTLNPQMIEMVRAAYPNVLTSAEDDALERLPEDLLKGGFGDSLRSAVQSRSVVRAEHIISASQEDEPLVWQVTVAPLDEGGDGAGVLILVDDATDQTRLRKRLQQAQKMDSIGQLTAGIAHEINNPMAYVRANLGTMEAVREDLASVRTDCPKSAETLVELETLIAESIEGVERTIAIVRDMREFSFAGEHAECSSDLAPVLEACIRIAEISHARGSTIHFELPEFVEVAGAAGPLRQVFLNLVVNALQAVDGEGNVWLRVVREGAWANVQVEDDGPGIPAAARLQLFDPFYTTKSSGEGTGLGLYISHEIVRSYGGEIKVAERAGGGACFEVMLPLSGESPG